MAEADIAATLALVMATMAGNAGARRAVAAGETSTDAATAASTTSTSTCTARAGGEPLSFASLPAAFKASVLGMLDGDTQRRAMRARTDEFLVPAVRLAHERTDATALRLLTEHDLRQLDAGRVVVKDGFVNDADELALMRAEARALEPAMRAAGMSTAAERWAQSDVRGDLVLWLNDRDVSLANSPALRRQLERLDRVRDELNAATGLNSTRVQSHLALYPARATRYVRHLDSSATGSQRRLTCLYYMNADYQPEHGGALRAYYRPWRAPAEGSAPTTGCESALLPPSTDDESLETYEDIEPRGDRVVFFQSRMVEHEVLPSHAPRLALTSWFY